MAVYVELTREQIEAARQVEENRQRRRLVAILDRFLQFTDQDERERYADLAARFIREWTPEESRKYGWKNKHDLY